MKRKISRSTSQKPLSDQLTFPMTLNKFIAKCGLASRRKAAEIVKQGNITVNDELETNPARKVDLEDKVKHKGKPLSLENKPVYLLLNKPKNVLCTVSDPRGRKTVIDIVKNHVSEKLYPVGRLDRNTLGLIMLTNDGDFTQRIAHPRNEIEKVYHVMLDRIFSKRDLEKLRKGLELEDGFQEIDAANYLEGKSKKWVAVVLHSGKNRIVRRLFEHLEYEVKILDRVAIGHLTKKDLPRGKWRNLKQDEINLFMQRTHKKRER